MALFAAVIVDIKSAQVDRIFDYRVPGHMTKYVMPGIRVIVPFGGRNQKTEGYVMEVSDTTTVPDCKLKDIYQLLDDGQPIFLPQMLTLAKWMKEKYFCTLSQCLQAIMPAGIKTRSTFLVQQIASDCHLNFTKQEQSLLNILSVMKQPAEVLRIAEAFGQNPWPVLQSLKEKKVLHIWQNTKGQDYILQEKRLWIKADERACQAIFVQAKKDRRLTGQAKILEYLLNGKSATARELKGALGVSDSPIETLIKKKILVEEFIEKRRDVLQGYGETQTNVFIPTPEQKTALLKLQHERKQDKKRPVLIHGITGSGKTEIYMQIIQSVLLEGKQAIVLVPEISLTPQLVERFVSRFGARVTATHSRMSPGERYDQWRKARDGDVGIMIGPRSALFTPFSNLGIVVIDEEHENSYRSDTTPKYDARETANKLCEITNSLLVLGSATPDIATYHQAMLGEYALSELNSRTNTSGLPEIVVSDMRIELAEGNRALFSRRLLEAIWDNLKNKQQTILFINRRGYSTFVSCRKCGYVCTCDACSVSYTYHAYENELWCHYCGKRIENPKICPACGSSYIKYFGTGTQKVEQEVRKLFPAAGVLRMDMDTTTGKHSHQQILEQFGSGKADIMIGTQMIAKGHDFPNVTLVGILAADLSLHQNSYHAAETCFQLITQAAGRSGRGEIPGRVFIQSYQPEHYSIQCAAKQDYKRFYEEEIILRRQMEYPPFSSLFTVLISGGDEKEVIEGAQCLGHIMNAYNRKGRFTILGPTPAVLSKLKNEYRWRIIVKCKEEEPLRNFGIYCINKWKAYRSWRGLLLNITMNPLTIV